MAANSACDRPKLDASLGGLAYVHGKPATAARLDLANGLQYLGTDIALGVALEDVLAQPFHGFTIFSF